MCADFSERNGENRRFWANALLDFRNFCRFLKQRKSLDTTRRTGLHIRSSASDTALIIAKVEVMARYTALQQIGATAVATGLFLISGCRSASVSSGPGYYPGSWSVPFYRSFERSTPTPDNSLTPTPVPDNSPDILPVPGYSEPEVPPSPSAQKSQRKGFLNSSFKLPGFGRQPADVHQTAAKTDDHSTVVRLRKPKFPPVRETTRPTEEIVHSRSTDREIPLTAPQPLDSEIVELRAPQSLPVVTPRSPRSGASRQWPQANTNNNGETGFDKSNSPSAVSTEGEMPLLLPPAP